MRHTHSVVQIVCQHQNLSTPTVVMLGISCVRLTRSSSSGSQSVTVWQRGGDCAQSAVLASWLTTKRRRRRRPTRRRRVSRLHVDRTQPPAPPPRPRPPAALLPLADWPSAASCRPNRQSRNCFVCSRWGNISTPHTHRQPTIYILSPFSKNKFQ